MISQFSGPLLDTFITDMKMKVRNEFNQTLHLYSGHDITVGCLLTTLGVFNWQTPPYSCAVLIELRKKNEDYIVTVSESFCNYSKISLKPIQNFFQNLLSRFMNFSIIYQNFLKTSSKYSKHFCEKFLNFSQNC